MPVPSHTPPSQCIHLMDIPDVMSFKQCVHLHLLLLLLYTCILITFLLKSFVHSHSYYTCHSTSVQVLDICTCVVGTVMVIVISDMIL